ncbi:MAG: C-terminal conserved region, partial [Thermomicrobiales bacterium]|nr:C-terminal conserved region [Thermomicrobiales bacterium]
MADTTVTTVPTALSAETITPARPATLDEARSMARRRFKERLEQGEKIGGCDCHTDEGEATAVRTFGAKIRERGLPMKPISAEFNFDGSHLTLNFSAADRI